MCFSIHCMFLFLISYKSVCYFLGIQKLPCLIDYLKTILDCVRGFAWQIRAGLNMPDKFEEAFRVFTGE